MRTFSRKLPIRCRTMHILSHNHVPAIKNKKATSTKQLTKSKIAIFITSRTRLRCQAETSISWPSQIPEDLNSRLSCVYQTFICVQAHNSVPSRDNQIFANQSFACQPDFCAFMYRPSCSHVQDFVRSCPDFYAFIKISCVHLCSGHTCFRLRPQPGVQCFSTPVNAEFFLPL